MLIFHYSSCTSSPLKRKTTSSLVRQACTNCSMFSSPSSPTSIFWNICLAIVSTSSWHDIQYYMEDLLCAPLELPPCHEVCPRSQASHQVQQCLWWNSSTTCESLKVTFSLTWTVCVIHLKYPLQFLFWRAWGWHVSGDQEFLDNWQVTNGFEPFAYSPESQWFLLYRCQINWKGVQRKFSHFLVATATLVKQTQPRFSLICFLNMSLK